ncbi:MAG: hypothetical protein HRT71_10870 [Flavobacteriales bacterium]|nr:hypothetical protein [Flavobacteriales bacterium]
MKNELYLFVSISFLFSCGLETGNADKRELKPEPLEEATSNSSVIPWSNGIPVYDHIVIVMEENKDYDQIIASDSTPYISSLLPQGANFVNMYGEEHHSQSNYFWLFSANDQGVGFEDKVSTKNNPVGYPFTAANLAS